MKWVGILVVGCIGCTPGDNLGAPKLVERTRNLVPVSQLVFDVANQPLGLLATDYGKRLARLGDGGWQMLDTAKSYHVLDVGEAADGTLLATVGDLSPGSGVFALGDGDELRQRGGRLTTALIFGPYESPTGDLYVSSVDGGRRLARGSEDWGIAKALAQVVRTPDAIYGLSSAGLERVDVDDPDGVGTVVVPCAALPGPCSAVHFDGRDGDGRLYFHADGAPALWVLEPGADAPTPRVIAGAHELGTVRATPDYVVVETLADEHAFLYVLRDGAFTLVDKAADPELTHPVVAVDREGTVFLAHGDWLGTLQLE